MTPKLSIIHKKGKTQENEFSTMQLTSSLNVIDILHLLRLNFVSKKITDPSIQRNFTVIYSTTKMISNNGMTSTHPKELPLGNEYANTFTEATIHNQKFNSVKAYICWNIEIAILYKQFLYSTNGDKTILPLLKTNNMGLKWKKKKKKL